MKLKVVEAVLEDFGVNAVIVVVPLGCLLPFEVEEEKLAITDFFPIPTRGEHLPHDPHIVSSPKIVSQSGTLLFRVYYFAN